MTIRHIRPPHSIPDLIPAETRQVAWPVRQESLLYQEVQPKKLTHQGDVSRFLSAVGKGVAETIKLLRILKDTVGGLLRLHLRRRVRQRGRFQPLPTCLLPA